MGAMTTLWLAPAGALGMVGQVTAPSPSMVAVCVGTLASVFAPGVVICGEWGVQCVCVCAG